MPTLLILGMHRSGTSLVAQTCCASGISAGPTEELLSAQADNPEGFFENERLVQVNDAFLAKAAGSWFDPPVAEVETWAIPGGEQLLAHLRKGLAGDFFLKDPRLCLTLNNWKLLEPTVTELFVYRSPLAVARSLQKRNSFPLQLGLSLWEIYNRRVLAAVGEDALTISYDDVVEKPILLERLLTSLQGRGFSVDPAAAADIFNADLSHFVTPEHSVDWLLSNSQRALHDFCVSFCKGERPEFPDLEPEEGVLARIKDLAGALAPLARVVETANERDDALALIEERTKERDQSLAVFNRLDVDHKALVSAHQAEKADHQKAAKTLKALSEDHKALAEAHRAETAAHGQLYKAHDELVGLHDQLHRDFDRKGLELNDALQTVGELEDKSKYLFHELTEANRDLIRFELSFLARLQRWLRRAYRLVTFQRGKKSAYEDLLERAHLHFSSYELEKPQPPVRKWQMVGDVVRYVARNPSGSARSFSWARLRRATSIFFGSSADDLSVWVNARFPDGDQAVGAAALPENLPESLDTLELHFEVCPSPQVSIIIPVFNDYRVTMNCLESLAQYAGRESFEVIIADDCSTDLTTSITERVSGIKRFTTAENQRFLRNCNNAAQHARGDYVLFLNNDTRVTEGWLQALLAPFSDPQVGVTGPKLLFADGKLQEAGGIIWRDASGWNFGRADDPTKPAYNYLHEVDYVSGACLLVRHSLWKEMGGFDERFAPAYYEDADLCFTVRSLGYRVMYQPESVVYHYEGVSNGTDLQSGVKQHQVTNQAVFREKWQEVLDAEHFENAEHVVHARDRSRDQYSVLFIDHYVPHWDKDAGSRSTFLYVKLLRELGCRVQFMGANFFPHAPYTKALESMGVEVLVGESVARHLDRWLSEHEPYIDEIFLHRPHVAEQFLPHLEKLSECPPISFFGHDLHYLRLAREAEVKADETLRKEAEQWRRRELRVFDRVDKIYYFSSAELEELADTVPADKLRCVPLYAMPAASIPAYEKPDKPSILFIGGYNHPPNIDSACWLAESLLPALQEQFPDIHLHLVGSNPVPAVLDLAGSAVTVHGYLSDQALADLYRQISMAVVPLRYGAGVKGKVIEAVQQGVPVVTTDIGAEGIPEADRVLSIANTEEELVNAIASLLNGGKELDRRLTAYPDWLDAHFSRQNAAEQLAADRPGLALAVDNLPNK